MNKKKYLSPEFDFLNPRRKFKINDNICYSDTEGGAGAGGWGGGDSGEGPGED